ISWRVPARLTGPLAPDAVPLGSAVALGSAAELKGRTAAIRLNAGVADWTAPLIWMVMKGLEYPTAGSRPMPLVVETGVSPLGSWPVGSVVHAATGARTFAGEPVGRSEGGRVAWVGDAAAPGAVGPAPRRNLALKTTIATRMTITTRAASPTPIANLLLPCGCPGEPPAAGPHPGGGVAGCRAPAGGDPRGGGGGVRPAGAPLPAVGVGVERAASQGLRATSP